MTESAIGILVQAGAVGLALVALFLIFWIVRMFMRRDDNDRLVLTNHLSGLLKDDIESRKQITSVLTSLTDAVKNSGGKCAEMQKEMEANLNNLGITQQIFSDNVEYVEKLVKSQNKQGAD